MPARPTTTSLTQREEQCLRLVADGFMTDEIARQLGLSSHTVNRYVEDAMRKLNGAGRGRRAVAREFVRLHQAASETPEPLVSEPLGVEAEPSTQLQPTSADAEVASEGGPIGAPDEARRSNLLGYLPFRRQGQREVGLTAMQVVLWVALLALLIMIMAGAVLTNLETASRLRQEGVLDLLRPPHRPLPLLRRTRNDRS